MAVLWTPPTFVFDVPPVKVGAGLAGAAATGAGARTTGAGARAAGAGVRLTVVLVMLVDGAVRSVGASVNDAPPVLDVMAESADTPGERDADGAVVVVLVTLLFTVLPTLSLVRPISAILVDPPVVAVDVVPVLAVDTPVGRK